MNADTKTLLKLFGADVQYEVPIFSGPMYGSRTSNGTRCGRISSPPVINS